MDYALSNDDITRLLKGRVKIVRYRDISKYNSIDQLLSPYNRVFILYEAHDGYGHWTLLHRIRKGHIELFDSYGLKIDDELDYIPASYKRQSNQTKAHLSKLLANSSETVHYNDFPLQATKKGISTCGRWCVARAVNGKLPIDRFNELIMQQCEKEKITPDALVCQLVQV